MAGTIKVTLGGGWPDCLTILSVGANNGKILVCCYDATSGSAAIGFAAVRLTAGGSLDTIFDGDGIGVYTVGSGTSEARTMALQADGKILLAGYSYNGTSKDFAIILKLMYHAVNSLFPLLFYQYFQVFSDRFAQSSRETMKWPGCL